MSTCLVDMKINVATVKTEKGLIGQSHVELHSSATRKAAKSALTTDSFLKLILSVYAIPPSCSERDYATILHESSLFSYFRVETTETSAKAWFECTRIRLSAKFRICFCTE